MNIEHFPEMLARLPLTGRLKGPRPSLMASNESNRPFHLSVSGKEGTGGTGSDEMEAIGL